MTSLKDLIGHRLSERRLDLVRPGDFVALFNGPSRVSIAKVHDVEHSATEHSLLSGRTVLAKGDSTIISVVKFFPVVCAWRFLSLVFGFATDEITEKYIACNLLRDARGTRRLREGDVGEVAVFRDGTNIFLDRVEATRTSERNRVAAFPEDGEDLVYDVRVIA